MNQKLFEEIIRVHELSGVNTSKFFDDSYLVLEAVNPIPKLLTGFEKFLDANAERVAERNLPTSTETNLEKRISKFVADRIGSDVGKKEIREFIKKLSESSDYFAQEFVKNNEKELEKITNKKGLDVTKRVIKSSFGDRISNAFDKFISNKITVFDINEPENILKFQKWLKNNRIWNNEKFQKNLNQGLTDETKFAWNKYKEKFQKSLGFSHNLKVAQEKILNKQIGSIENGWWDSNLSFLHPATRMFIFNSVRKSLLYYIRAVSYEFRKTQSVIDELMSKFLTAAEMQQGNYEKSEDLFRDISIQMAALRTNAKQDYTLFLRDIKKTLENSGVDYTTATNIVENLKEYSAYDKLFKTEKPRKEGYTWITDVIENTVFVKFAKELRFFYKEIFKKIFRFVERTLMFLTTGHIRTVGEITDFCVSSGLKQGLKQYILVLYGMKFLMTPLVLSIFNFAKASIGNLIHNDWGIKAEDTGDLIGKTEKFSELYKKLIFNPDLETVLPFNYYWDDILGKSDQNARQELNKNSKIKTSLEKLREKYKISYEEAEELEKIILSGKSEEEIKNDTKEFIKRKSKKTGQTQNVIQSPKKDTTSSGSVVDDIRDNMLKKKNMTTKENRFT